MMQKEPGYDIIYISHIKALSPPGRRREWKKDAIQKEGC